MEGNGCREMGGGEWVEGNGCRGCSSGAGTQGESCPIQFLHIFPSIIIIIMNLLPMENSN